MNYYHRSALLPQIIGLLVALGIAVGFFTVLLTMAGCNAYDTLLAIFRGAFGSTAGIRETLSRSTPLLLCALAVAVPARAGLFNIGGEGQLHLGAIAATAVALQSGSTSPLVMIPMMILAACLAGALWGAIPGALKAILNVNEVLVALMLNYVAVILVEYLVHGPWKDPTALGWPYTAAFPDAAILPQWNHTNIHLGLAIAIAAAIVLWFIVTRTTFGFSVKVIEDNPVVARSVGIPIKSWILITMALGGAMAAIAGMGEVSVIQGRLRPGLSPGYGYIGFLISWMAGHRFIAIVAASLLIGGLFAGSDALQLTASLPSSTFDIMLGIFFIAVLLASPLRRMLEVRRFKGLEE